MMARTPSDRGFTLIEMLVALALMGLIAIILITSLQIGGHAWQRVTRATSNTEDIAQAQEIIRDRLGTLYPGDTTAKISHAPFLVSNGESLEFVSAAPDSIADGILRYQLAVSASSGSLEVRSWRDNPGDQNNLSSDSKPEQLLSQVASMAVQFWLKPGAAPGHWVDHWDSKEVPQLIRIDVAFGTADKRRWPPLYVEPRVDTPADCVFDVVSRRCRSGA